MQGPVIRTIFGNASLYALLGVSIFGSRFIFPALQKARLLPGPEPRP